MIKLGQFYHDKKARGKTLYYFAYTYRKNKRVLGILAGLRQGGAFSSVPEKWQTDYKIGPPTEELRHNVVANIFSSSEMSWSERALADWGMK